MASGENNGGCLRLFVSGMGRKDESPNLTLNQGGAVDFTFRHVKGIAFPATSQGGVHETSTTHYPGNTDSCCDNYRINPDSTEICMRNTLSQRLSGSGRPTGLQICEVAVKSENWRGASEFPRQPSVEAVRLGHPLISRIKRGKRISPLYDQRINGISDGRYCGCRPDPGLRPALP